MSCTDKEVIVVQVFSAVAIGSYLPRLFQPQEVYCYDNKITKLEKCHCPGKPEREVQYFVVIINGKTYHLREGFVEEGFVNIPKESMGDGFEARRENVGEPAPDVNIRMDAVIREEFGKVPM